MDEFEKFFAAQDDDAAADRANRATNGSYSNGHDEPPRRQLKPLTAAEFLALKLPPREFVLDPLLPTKGLAMVYSVRGVGKTFLAISIAYAVATGSRLLGWSAPKPRKVLYIDGEMPAESMQRRLAAVVQGFDNELPEPDYLRLLSADTFEFGLPDLGAAMGQAEIDDTVGDAELLIVDNCSTLVRSGKENEGEGWLPTQGWALSHRRAGRSVLFVHHAGKNGMQRGTSRREDVLDTVLTLKRPVDYEANQGARFEVVIEKGRGVLGDDALTFEARYEERNGAAWWSRSEIADVELMRVVETLRDGASVRDAAAELQMSKSKVDRLKQKAVGRGMLNG